MVRGGRRNPPYQEIQHALAPTSTSRQRRRARHRGLRRRFSGPGSYYRGSAYNLGADPRFQQFAHTGSVVTIDFWMEGVGLQDLNDESWAMDNLRVVAFTAAVPEPTTYALMLAGLGCIGVAIRRRSR